MSNLKQNFQSLLMLVEKRYEYLSLVLMFCSFIGFIVFLRPFPTGGWCNWINNMEGWRDILADLYFIL